MAKMIRDHMMLHEGECGSDFLSTRYGGEEFSIVLPGLNLEKAVHQAEAIRKKIEGYSFIIRDVSGKIIHRQITITVSIGVSQRDPSWKESLAEHLVETADQALYRAKSEGRNKVCS